jgi:hypothetical protein
VVTLTIGSISLRTLNRTSQAIGDRQQQVIYNIATPAIDRAKAKIDFLFDPRQDDRLPTGVPGEQQLLNMMLNRPPADPGNIQPDELRQLLITTPDGDVDPYTFPDERTTAQRLGLPAALDGRLDIGGGPNGEPDGIPDNAWVYAADTDGNGIDDALVVYSILFQTPTNIDELANASDEAVADRANVLQVRNAPLSSIVPADPACQNRADAPPIETGWFTDLAASRKNFQVDAVVIPVVESQVQANDQFVPSPTATTATLEFQQDRQYDEGNKWGAWFRNDLEVYSAPVFNWNGAMHTEGSLIVGRNNKFRAYLVSAPNSCIYDQQSSEITLADDLEDATPFKGQVIAGQLFAVDAAPKSLFHIHDDEPITDGAVIEVEQNTDSIANNNDLEGLSLDPVLLFTQDDSVPRAGNGNVDFEAARDDDWDERALSKADNSGRIYNTGTQSAPRIDDFFRADNRLGPKPRYDDQPIAGLIGTPTTDPILTRNNAVNGNVGLDGYWERRARAEGMRVIVGQRLELGNAFGWRGAALVNLTDADTSNNVADDPLYPWDNAACTERCHEAKQRRTLRDNLAAVQAMAVYHAAGANDDGDFPKFCMAATVHPGTPTTINNSTTYAAFPGLLPVGQPDLDISFFDGHGTNGLEYAPPAASASAFANAIAPTQPLGIALRNLAHFAGDPEGGTPSFSPVQDDVAGADSVVHPYPNLTMWGNFSMLRRIFDDELDAGAGTTYASLSPADKTYLHTAACTLGMLASNVDVLDNFSYDTNLSALQALDTAIGDALTDLTDSSDASTPYIEDSGATTWAYTPPNVTVSTDIRKPNGVTVTAPPDAIIAALPDAQKRLAEIIHLKEQTLRDRQFGFEGSLLCSDLRAFATANSLSSLEALCPIQPKFPALYYLFPLGEHRHDGRLADGSDPNPLLGDLGAVQPSIDPTTSQVLEPYVGGSPYVFDINNPLLGVNADYLYSVVVPTDVAVAPKTTVGTWLSPTATATADSANVIEVAGTPVSTSFLDKGVYNGRDLMATRVLDLDLNLLRTNVIASGAGSDTWLPKLSIVYAFREDAIREDMIVRPASATASCANDAEIQGGAGCIMNAIGEFQNPDGTATNLAQDPPLTANGISPKAVDYYADPDRLPNGFRLQNGETIKRDGDDGRGLSFISDDPVYIQGNFNLHLDANGNRIEEFQEKLPEDGEFNPQEFYDDRVNLEPAFARQDTDSWRPTELLSDSITLLSENFCDGSAADLFLTAGGASGNAEITTAQTQHDGFAGYDISAYRCNGVDTRTSYLNQNRPTNDPDADEIWRRENPFDFNSPIEVDRNGAPRFMDDLIPYPNSDYRDFGNGRSISYAAPTRVNAVLFNGIVPSRPRQSYGGLHNFPRLLEKWGEPDNRTTLAISGAFIQLNFSNYATAAYDQEAWEPEANPTTLTDDEAIRYYSPPTRAWGYDVGLQYAPAAPITRRFSNPGSFRSEFYTEPEANDPYMCKLRNVVNDVLVPDNNQDLCAA